MEFKDYYKVLGVARDSGADDIKKAWRRLARKYHPDVSKEADAGQRMSEVNEAYEVLSDADRRAAYDQLGRGRHGGETFTPPPDWGRGFDTAGPAFAEDAGDYSDFFRELFGRMGDAAQARRSHGASGPQRGQDRHARLVLDLDDAWRGAVRELVLESPQFDDQGRVTLREKRLQVTIPAGVKPGQLIRLAGQGDPGIAGAAAGDLLLEVQLRPHARFRVEGADLIGELPVAPWEAALGAVVPVLLPGGSTLKVRVPAGAQGDQVLTVRGKGLPASKPGDLELRLRIVLPSAYDPRAKKLYEQMAADLSEFDARKVAQAERERDRTEQPR